MSAEPSGALPRKLPGAVVALGVTSLLSDVGSEMIFPLLPMFVVSLGAGPTFLGLLEGLADAVASFLKLASGMVSDRRANKKPLVVFGYSLAALSRPLVALATAPWHVLVIRVSDRIGKGIRTAPRDVMIATAAPHGQSGRSFGFHRAMDHTGAVLGPLVAAGLMALGASTRQVFALALIPGLIAVVVVALVREPRAAATPAPALSVPPTGARLPVQLRRYFGILVVFSLANSSDVFLLARAPELGMSPALLPALWTVLSVSKMVSTYVGGPWADRVPRAYLIAGGWVVYGVSYTGFALATASWHMWVLFAFYGLHHGLTEPAEKALVKELAPASLRGRAYGVYNFIIGASAIPAGVLMGWFWSHAGSKTALLLAAGLASLAAAVTIAWARAAIAQPAQAT